MRSASPNRRSPGWKPRSRTSCARSVTWPNSASRSARSITNCATCWPPRNSSPTAWRACRIRPCSALRRGSWRRSGGPSTSARRPWPMAESKRRLPQRRRVRLRPLVAELMELTDLAPGAAIAFQADVPDNLVIDADPDHLSRILVNLVRNAVQALSQAGSSDGPPRIAVSAAREGRSVTILVSDNGPGVPERARPNLFAAFQGAGRAGGVGLGLVISAELVRLHGGTLSLDDTRAGAR